MRPRRIAVSDRTQRVLAIAAAVLVVIALSLLAMGLPGLELKPGQHFNLPAPPAAPPLRPPDPLPDFFLDVLLVIVAVLFGVSLFFVARSSEDRKEVIKRFSRVMLLAALVLLALTVNNALQGPEVVERGAQTAAPEQAGPPAQQAAAEPTVPPTEVAPSTVPGWISYGLTVLVVLGVGALLYWVWRLIHPSRLELHDIAQSALDDLAAGRDWEDAVIRCYADMSRAVVLMRGVRRPEAMTPREFAARLESTGLPADAVRNLTRLFEKARYSHHASSMTDTQDAMACLRAIVEAAERER